MDKATSAYQIFLWNLRECVLHTNPDCRQCIPATDYSPKNSFTFSPVHSAPVSLRHGIVKIVLPAVKRVTPRNALDGKPRSLCGAVFLQRLKRVLGTCGDIAAAGLCVRRDIAPVKFYQRDQNALHASVSVRSSSFLHADRKAASSWR